MQRHEASKTQIRPRRLTYANVMVTILAFLVLGGATAFAAGQLAKNSVGSRQIKSKSVTTGKIANNAVNGAKVANGSLTGSDINLAALGTVPTATSAVSAGNANTVGGHAAACLSGTTLIRGICFDSHSNSAAPSLEAAAEACAAKGGWLPTPMELYSTKGVLNLGTGVGAAQHQYTDALYGVVGGGSPNTTVVINGVGAPEEYAANLPSAYTCAYALVR
jgi:hypothetical protein